MLTPEQKIRTKRWNERVKLVVTTLNVTAIGTFGLAVVSPLFEHARLVSDSSRNELIDSEKLGSFTIASDLQWWELVNWPFASVALALHLMAHVTVALIDPEE